jgi:hypothetical protein
MLALVSSKSIAVLRRAGLSGLGFRSALPRCCDDPRVVAEFYDLDELTVPSGLIA